MDEWQLSRDKVNVILTDNGSNMVAAFREEVESDSDDHSVIDDSEEVAKSGSTSPQHEDEEHSEDGEEQENGVEVHGDILNFEQHESEFDIAFTLNSQTSKLFLSHATTCGTKI